MYHEINVRLEEPAQIAIEGGQLTVTAGHWPDFGDPVAVGSVVETLQDTDRFVYLDRQGGLVLADGFIPYGQGHEMCDLLAWRENDEWHVKRLVTEVLDA